MTILSLLVLLARGEKLQQNLTPRNDRDKPNKLVGKKFTGEDIKKSARDLVEELRSSFSG